MADPSPPVYLVLDPNLKELTRSNFDPTIDIGVNGIAIAPDNTPVIVYSHPGLGGGWEIVSARRHNDRWQRTVVFVSRSSPTVSNVTCDREGKVRVAFRLDDNRRVFLATGSGDTWTTELVYEDAGTCGLGESFAPVTLLDSKDTPLVVVIKRSFRDGWMRVFEPAAKEQ